MILPTDHEKQDSGAQYPKMQLNPFSFLGSLARPLTLNYITCLAGTCCEMEKPIIMSPSGTSQETFAESARRFMTETLMGAGGRSEGKKIETQASVNTKLPSPSVPTQNTSGVTHHRFDLHSKWV